MAVAPSAVSSTYIPSGVSEVALASRTSNFVEWTNIIVIGFLGKLLIKIFGTCLQGIPELLRRSVKLESNELRPTPPGCLNRKEYEETPRIVNRCTLGIGLADLLSAGFTPEDDTPSSSDLGEP
jgi:hypothetical protein